NTQFFNPANGGDVLLYQHLFWFFGHPDVYIIFLPGTAIVSTLVPVFARRHTFGYIGIVTSIVATAFLGFGVWVHHMFATGIPKITGRMMNDLLGKIHFWLFFVGFNVTFFTMHFLGLRGMPRRVYTYPPEMHWGGLNMLASVGALFMTAGILVFIVNFFQSKA